jgi:hypothetical protein
MPALLAPNASMTETKLLGGEIALDGTNPTPISTGLRTVTAVSLTLRGAVARATVRRSSRTRSAAALCMSTPGRTPAAPIRRSSRRPARRWSAT